MAGTAGSLPGPSRVLNTVLTIRLPFDRTQRVLDRAQNRSCSTDSQPPLNGAGSGSLQNLVVRRKIGRCFGLLA